jgi:hypothetical protein
MRSGWLVRVRQSVSRHSLLSVQHGGWRRWLSRDEERETETEKKGTERDRDRERQRNREERDGERDRESVWSIPSP